MYANVKIHNRLYIAMLQLIGKQAITRHQACTNHWCSRRIAQLAKVLLVTPKQY
jgi:hypothetical protein